MKRSTLKFFGQPWLRYLVRFTPYIASGLILIILPAFLPSYLQSMMTKVLIFAIFAVSLDFIFGYAGLLSLGHAAYFGVAGYTAGILMVRYGIESFWIVAPLGILVAIFTAAIFGVIALRVSGMYFLLVTFALGQLMYSVAWRFDKITGGSHGLPGIPYPELGLPWLIWNANSFYYFVLIAFVICFFLMYRIINSPFGDALQGVRDSETRMRALGYNTWLYKYIAFIIGGFFAGVAGVLFAPFNGLMHPMQAGFFTSSLVWLFVIIGGAGTLWGPVIGTGLIVFVEYFSSMYTPERWPMILGGFFVIAVMFLRGGIAPHLLRFWRKVSYGSAKG